MFLPILSGVPQGRRPMLYLIYVDDLPLLLSISHTLKVADDMLLFFYQLHLARTVLISKIIFMKYHISVLNGNSFLRNL